MSTETMTTGTTDAPSRACKPREKASNGSSQLGGTIWFCGWLFTIGYAQLAWWKAILAVLFWPYFLGLAVR